MADRQSGALKKAGAVQTRKKVDIYSYYISAGQAAKAAHVAHVQESVTALPC